jgi:DNA-binding response OmpR family regulator
MNKKILIVEDDLVTQALLKTTLSNAGYIVDATGEGKKAIELATEFCPDLVLLDGMLDDIDGNEVCDHLKSNEETAGIPIFMLSARIDEENQLTGLRLGADDYITKPFSPPVLVEKINIAFRKAQEPRKSTFGSQQLAHNGMVIIPSEHSVKYNDGEIKLTAVEYRLLYFLVSNPGKVFSREAILDEIRGNDVIITECTVDVHILSLRRKVGEFATYIETVRGVGYRVQA